MVQTTVLSPSLSLSLLSLFSLSSLSLFSLSPPPPPYLFHIHMQACLVLKISVILDLLSIKTLITFKFPKATSQGITVINLRLHEHYLLPVSKLRKLSYLYNRHASYIGAQVHNLGVFIINLHVHARCVTCTIKSRSCGNFGTPMTKQKLGKNQNKPNYSIISLVLEYYY